MEPVLQNHVVSLDSDVFGSWCSIGKRLALMSHSQIADFLVNSYLQCGKPQSCGQCGSPMSWVCRSCPLQQPPKMQQHHLGLQAVNCKRSEEQGPFIGGDAVEDRPVAINNAEDEGEEDELGQGQHADGSQAAGSACNRQQPLPGFGRPVSTHQQLPNDDAETAPAPDTRMAASQYDDALSDASEGCLLSGASKERGLWLKTEVEVDDADLYTTQAVSAWCSEAGVETLTSQKTPLQPFSSCSDSSAKQEASLSTSISLGAVKDLDNIGQAVGGESIADNPNKSSVGIDGNESSASEEIVDREIPPKRKKKKRIKKITPVATDDPSAERPLPKAKKQSRFRHPPQDQQLEIVEENVRGIDRCFYKGGHVCDVCQKGFTTRTYLREHRLLHTSSKRHVCELCGKAFTQSSHLKQHVKSHTGEKPFECEQCHKFFSSKGYLRVHRSIHLGKTFVCHVCGTAFATAMTLKGHMLSHASQKMFQCNVCEKAFTRAGRLVLHKKHHTGEKPYVCEVCRKSFVSAYCLKLHLEVHSEKTFHCTSCSRHFATERRLLVHTRSVHDKHQQRFGCGICNTRFSSAALVNRHMIVMHEKRECLKGFKCDKCEQSFLTKSCLQNHGFVHSSLRPYVCEVCAKGFKRWSDLRHHKKTHNSEKNHVCLVCSKSFTMPEYLRQHRVLHEEQPRHSCEICKKGFARPSELQRHRLIHSKTKSKAKKK